MQHVFATKHANGNNKHANGKNKHSGGNNKKAGGNNKNSGGNNNNNQGGNNNGKPVTYYFSNNSGNDLRSSDQAQNPSTPWKTLNKLNSIFPSLHPGDAVLLKRGETFYGSITVSQSGTAKSPITIGSYGTGSKPVITSLVTLSGWKQNPSYKGVYDCSPNALLGLEVNIVLLNDALKAMGRFPNLDAPNKGYLILESHAGNKKIIDRELKSSPNWTGAELVLRQAHWKIDRCKITSHSGTTINYIGQTAQNDYGYFIQNSIKTLDQLGEWYYNPSTKKLSMYFGSNSPSSYTVKASSINNLVYSIKKSYVVIDNLTFKGANKYGIDINRGNNIQVKNCDVLSSGIDGVNVAGHAYFNIENCTVSDSYNNGIAAGLSNNYAVVRNNIVKNSYTVAGMGQSGEGQGAGIRINTNGLVEYNEVINSGFIGINMNGDHVTVKNNYINTFAFVKDDGGGIYTYNKSNTPNSARKITGNIILNGIGAGAGTNTPNSSADGIYLDGYVNGLEISSNTIANSNKGLYLHNTRDIVVKNNTLYNNEWGQLHMKHDAHGGFQNQTITNNIFFSKTEDQPVSAILSNFDDNDIRRIGKLDGNYYARPINDRAIIFSTIFKNSRNETRANQDLEDWKKKYGKDGTSRVSAKKLAPYKVKNIIGQNKYSFGSFNSSSDIKVFGNNCKLVWDNSKVLDGGNLKVVPTNKSSALILNVGAVSPSKKYILRYSVKGTGTMSIASYIRGSNYKPLTLNQYRIISTGRNNNEMMFTPTAADNSASLVFLVDAKKTYNIDNIQFYEAEAAITDPNDSIKFVINPSKIDKTVALDGNYVDAKNAKYSNSITLQPYTSAVLIKDGGSPRQKTGPTVKISTPVNEASFSGPLTIKVDAIAVEGDGKIQKVEFYNGATLLETQMGAPYTFNWNNVKAGSYTLTAKATDINGLSSTSSKVYITVNGKTNSSPSVKLTDPYNNSKFFGPATVNVTAEASDKDGTISKVEFYNGSRLLYTEHAYPYSFRWKNVTAGRYTLTAKAIDNSGKIATSAGVSFTVLAKKDSKPPEVNITDPNNNRKFKGPTTVRLVARAKAYGGRISKVEFYNGRTLLRTEYWYPYRYFWENVPVGNYTITAKAIDDKGVSTTSDVVRFSVESRGKSASSRPSSGESLIDTTEGEPNPFNGQELLKLSPNPTRSTLNISTDGLPQNKELTISIITVSGGVIKTVQSNSSNHVAQIDVSSLNNGVYIVKVVCENKVLSQQFVKL